MPQAVSFRPAKRPARSGWDPGAMAAAQRGLLVGGSLALDLAREWCADRPPGAATGGEFLPPDATAG